MIVTAFIPQGIVSMVSSADTLYHRVDADIPGDPPYSQGHIITGCPHIRQLGSDSVIVFKGLDQTVVSLDGEHLADDIMMLKGDDVTPPIDRLIYMIKDLIVQRGYRLMAHVCGYDAGHNPHVYEIMGENCWRINIDDRGDIFYNFAILERRQLAGRSLRPCQIRNGEIWETRPEVDLHAELQSIDKAIDTCRALLDIGKWLESPLDLRFSDMPQAETVIVTPTTITLR